MKVKKYYLALGTAFGLFAIMILTSGLGTTASRLGQEAMATFSPSPTPSPEQLCLDAFNECKDNVISEYDTCLTNANLEWDICLESGAPIPECQTILDSFNASCRAEADAQKEICLSEFDACLDNI